eukprot:jgi/Tetstr1/448424/TSEL_035694.t1
MSVRIVAGGRAHTGWRCWAARPASSLPPPSAGWTLRRHREGATRLVECGALRLELLMDKVFEIRMSAEGGQHTTAFRDVGGADILRWTLLGEEQGGSGGDVQAWRLIAAKYGDTQRIRA